MSRPEQTDGTSAAARNPRRWRLAALCLLLAPVCGVVLLTCVLAWALGSASGSRAALTALEAVSGGALRWSGLTGTLGRQLTLDEFAWRSRGLQISASGVRLEWQPARLWQGQLHLTSVTASSLRIASAPSRQAAQLPAELGLPLALEIEQLALGHLQLATLAADDQPSEVLALSAISASLRYQQHRYQLQGALTAPWGRLRLHGGLADASPFALDGQLNWQGQAIAAMPPLTVQGRLGGSLAALQVGLQASASAQQRLQGQASAVLTPFAAQPLRSLQLELQHLNPAQWQAAAPEADLRLQAQLAPLASQSGTPVASLGGQFSLSNARPAALNLHGLPLQSLQGQLHWQGQQISLQQIAARLNGNGQIGGQAQFSWQGGMPQAEAQLSLAGVDLRQIDQRLQTSHIQGQLQAHSAPDQRIQLQASLNDSKQGGARLQAAASYQPEQMLLSLRQFELQADAARLQGQGEFAFGGVQGFRFQGNLVNFDPARWLASPAGKLQATFNVQGQLQPRLQLQASLPQLQGQYGGQPLQARLDLRWLAGQQLQVKQGELHWGKNSLNAQGAWGGPDDRLQLTLDAPELAALNPLTAPLQLELGGSLQAQASLRGRISEVAGSLATQARQLQIRYRQHRLAIASLNGKLELGSGSQGVFDGELNAQQLRASKQAMTAGEPEQLEQLSLQLQGRREAHQIKLEALFPGKQQLHLLAGGGWQPAQHQQASSWNWQGLLQELTLQGKPELRLQHPAALQLAPQAVRLGSLQLQSDLGLLALDKLEWTPEALSSQGRLGEARVLAIARLIQPQYALDGDLKVNAQWQLQLKNNVSGEIRLQRHSGDLRISDIDGTGSAVPLGMRDLQLQLQAGGLVAGTAGENLALSLTADGERLGQWQLKANTLLSQQDGKWSVAPDAALQGQLSAAIPDLQWLGPWLNPGLALKGKLNVDANLGGVLAKPHYLARLSGRELELAFASEGLLLPNGTLDAQLEDGHLKLNSLRFANSVANLPRHAEFQGLPWLGQAGEFKASGEIDIGRETGSIQAQWQQFPLLQRKDRWLLVSGQASIVEANNVWSLNGKLNADGAYFKLPKMPPPSLSGDVVVSRNSDPAVRKPNGEAPKKGLKTRVDVSFEMGPHFVFVGRGIDTALAGSIRLRSADGAPLQASGTIRTVGGVYEGYGQQLAIERGILNFQGSPANPGLNIRALRPGLAVEAGVEVSGSVAAPQVRLVSEPSVPDAEKLSWLVLGRGADQLAGSDASLLMSAASAIFGGDGSRNVPRDIVQGLGFDEFSIGAAGNCGSSRLPGQTIAGNLASNGVSTAAGDQVVSIGKRLLPGLVLSVERGLSDASGAVKLSWQLTRRISITGRSGSESAVDAYYTFSFH